MKNLAKKNKIAKKPLNLMRFRSLPLLKTKKYNVFYSKKKSSFNLSFKKLRKTTIINPINKNIADFEKILNLPRFNLDLFEIKKEFYENNFGPNKSSYINFFLDLIDFEIDEIAEICHKNNDRIFKIIITLPQKIKNKFLFIIMNKNIKIKKKKGIL